MFILFQIFIIPVALSYQPFVFCFYLSDTELHIVLDLLLFKLSFYCAFFFTKSWILLPWYNSIFNQSFLILKHMVLTRGEKLKKKKRQCLNLILSPLIITWGRTPAFLYFFKSLKWFWYAPKAQNYQMWIWCDKLHKSQQPFSTTICTILAFIF